MAKYDDSCTFFFQLFIRTNGLVVKAGCRESGESVVTWVRFLMSAETLCLALAIWRGAEPVSALTRALFILLRLRLYNCFLEFRQWRHCGDLALTEL